MMLFHTPRSTYCCETKASLLRLFSTSFSVICVKNQQDGSRSATSPVSTTRVHEAYGANAAQGFAVVSRLVVDTQRPRFRSWRFTRFFTHAFFLFFLSTCSMYNNLVVRCFDSCVTSFRSKTLDKSELLCVDNCAGKLTCQKQTFASMEHCWQERIIS